MRLMNCWWLLNVKLHVLEPLRNWSLRGKKHLQYFFSVGEDYLQIESANPSAALFSLYSNWHEGPNGINTFTPHKAPTQLTYSYEG